MASAPTPQPAATVMLLRDGSAGMEVFMIVRHRDSDVHAGALVFPGGRVDPEDHEIARDAALFPARERLDPALAAPRVAAVRETFEECGVLLARPVGERDVVSAARLRDIEAAHRSALCGGQRSFGAILTAERLVLAPEAMVYFAHWISPERSPLRFDTHFFLATAPSEQIAVHDGLEAVESIWIAPGAALDSADAGTYQLPFPTRMNLRKIAGHRAAADALAAARASPVVTVMTKQERAGNGVRVLRIPLEAGYGGELFEVPDPPARGR